jgi:CBS domain-containing protein
VASFLSDNLEELSVSEFVEPSITVDPMETVSKLIGVMKNSKGYEAFVLENDRASIATLREILEVENALTTKVSKIMVAVPRLNGGDSAMYAARLMFENKLRALPVFREGKFVGKISSLAIVKRMLESKLINLEISKVMTRDPITLLEKDEVGKARSLMMRRRIDQLPILKNGKLDSVITSEAIVFSFLSQSPDRNSKGGSEEGRFDNPASSLASVETTVNNVKDPASKIAANMFDRATNYSIILDNGALTGIVTFRDFLKVLPIKENLESVPASIVGLPENPLEAELVTSKFRASVKTLQVMDPTVTEARAIIKNKTVNSGTMLHQVQVFVDALEWHESYETSGYDLSKIFAEIDTWIKRIATKHDRKPDHEKRRDKTIRKREPE